MMEWFGQLVLMVIIIGGSFLMGLSVGNEKRGKR